MIRPAKETGTLAAEKTITLHISDLLKNESPNGASSDIEFARICEILNNGNLQFHTRKLAALLLFKWRPTVVIREAPFLAGMLREADASRIRRTLRTWTAHVSRHGFPTGPGGFEYFSDLLKSKSTLRGFDFHSDERDVALWGTLFYLQRNKGKDSDKLLPMFTKSFLLTAETCREILSLLLSELPPGLQCKYDAISAVLKNGEARDELLPFLPSLLLELEKLTECQQASPTCASLVACLLRVYGTRSEIMEWITRLALSTTRSTRTNVHRAWLGRMAADSSLHSILLKILETCRAKAESPSLDPPLFPPSSEDAHDLTCLDPFWRWQESEAVYWLSDSATFACVSLLTMVVRRVSSLCLSSWSSLLAKAAASHDEDIHLPALRLINLHSVALSPSEVRSIVSALRLSDDDDVARDVALLPLATVPQVEEQEGLVEELGEAVERGGRVAAEALALICPQRMVDIVERLLEGDDDELRRWAKAFMQKKGLWGDERRRKAWRRIVDKSSAPSKVVTDWEWAMEGRIGDGERKEALAILQQIKHLPGERTTLLQCAIVFLRHGPLDKELELVEETTDRIEHLLRASGSTSNDRCPTFTDLNRSLATIGIEAKAFGREINASLSLLVESVGAGLIDARSVAELVLGVLLRTRHKSTVDHAAQLFDRLMAKHPDMADSFFDRLLPLLSSPSTEARSLSVARGLVAVCIARPHLVTRLEEQWNTQSSSPSSGLNLVRWLKTLKLFMSRASEIALSDDLVHGLFFHCLRLQFTSGDFLERSAAACLFSFCILRLTGPKGVSLFSLLGPAHDKFMRDVMHMTHELPSLPRIASVLLLSFIAKLDYASDGFYGSEWADRIEAARQSITALLFLTWWKRERRFVVDAVLALTPWSERSAIASALREGDVEEEGEEDAAEYLREILIGRRPLSKDEEETRFGRSSYYATVREAVGRAEAEMLLQIKEEDEQGEAAFCIGVEAVARGGKGGLSPSVEKRLRAARTHGRPRVRALAERAATALQSIKE